MIFQKRRLACNESRLIFDSCVTESVRSCFQKKSSHEKRFFGVVREGSVSVAEGDCCEFDSVLQFCTVQFCLRGAWEAAVELSSDQAGRGGLSSSRIGAILPFVQAIIRIIQGRGV